MKLIVLTALVAAAAGSNIYGNHGGPYGGAHVGAYEGAYGGGQGAYGGDYYAVPDYSTAHSIKDPYSGVDVDSQENRLGHKTEGSYSVLLPDGRKQVVTYWVDGKSGYNADVKYFGVAKHPKKHIGYGAPYGAHQGVGQGIGGPAGYPGAGFGSAHIY